MIISHIEYSAIDKSDDDVASSGAKSIHFYNSSQITTKNGFLVITTSNEDTKWKGDNSTLSHSLTYSKIN